MSGRRAGTRPGGRRRKTGRDQAGKIPRTLDYPDFRGKAVVLFCRGRDIAFPIVLAYPRFEVQAGRLFLVGVTPPRDSVGEWADGVPRGVAWECVDTYVLFDSVEEYLMRLSAPDDDGAPS